jgi:hypothetical protein
MDSNHECIPRELEGQPFFLGMQPAWGCAEEAGAIMEINIIKSIRYKVCFVSENSPFQ